MIYLDSAATTPILPSVKTAIFDTYDRFFGNPSSLHSSGTLARNLIEEVRKKVADYIGAHSEEIIFTSGATEANNTVFHIFTGKNIYISPLEHPSVAEPAKFYGKIVDDPKNAALISVMLANNETGHLLHFPNLQKSENSENLDIPENLNPPIKSPNPQFLHTDATSAIGKIPIDVKKLNLDYLTFSAHKIGGPLGIGVLYVKNGAPFSPLLLGGHQEGNRRAGTESVPLIASLGAAIDYLVENDTISLYETQVRPLKNLLAKEIKKKIESSIINSPLDPEKSLPSILNVSFPGAEGETIQLALDLEGGIIVSTGSACASGEPSHTLLSLAKNDPELAHSSIRFSLDLNTTEKDIEKVMEILPKIISKYRKISSYTRKTIKKDQK